MAGGRPTCATAPSTFSSRISLSLDNLFTMKVTELGARPVMREISTRDRWGFSRIALRTSRSLACRSADLRKAPCVVKVTADTGFNTYIESVS